MPRTIKRQPLRQLGQDFGRDGVTGGCTPLDYTRVACSGRVGVGVGVRVRVRGRPANTNHELCQPLLNGLKAGVESNILSENKSTEPLLVCVLLMQWQLLGGVG